MDILEVLKDALDCENIKSLLPNRKVYHVHISDKPLKPYLEYEVISDKGDFYFENKEQYRYYLVQVDLFSDKQNYYELSRRVKECMINAGFTQDSNNPELYEDSTRLFHKVLRFNISLPIQA